MARGKIIQFTVLTCVGVAGAGMVGAQAAGVRVRLAAVVPKQCTIDGKSGPVRVNIAIPVRADGRRSQPVQTIRIGMAICNSPARLTIAAMTGGNRSTAEGALSAVAYTATARFGAATATLTTEPSPARASGESSVATAVPVATRGPLVLTLVAESTGLPAEPSSILRDGLIVTLEPR